MTPDYLTTIVDYPLCHTPYEMHQPATNQHFIFIPSSPEDKPGFVVALADLHGLKGTVEISMSMLIVQPVFHYVTSFVQREIF